MSVMIYLATAGLEGKVKSRTRFIHMTGTIGAISKDRFHIVTELMSIHELYCGPWLF